MTQRAEFATDDEVLESLGIVGAGRKGKSAALRLSERVQMLLTREQRRILDAAARRDGQELTTWIRRVALEAAKSSQAHLFPKPE